MSVKLSRSISVQGFGTGHLRTGDLTGNGIPDFLLPQAYPNNRELFCLTAMDLDGKILWQYGTPHPEGYHIFSDVPVQIFDWDGDGRNEVLFIKQARYKIALVWYRPTASYITKDLTTEEAYDEIRWEPGYGVERSDVYDGVAQLIVLDGATGQEKCRYDLPASADDCLAFGYFDGSGKPNLLIKDRYWNIWAMDHDCRVLWSLSADVLGEGCGFGHFPGIGDIDGDGLDEVFITNTLIDSDGTILWQLPDALGHSDSVVILDDIPDRRIITGGDKVRCIGPDGTVIWSADAGHMQNVLLGRYSTDPAHGPYQFLARDIIPEYPDYITAGNNGHAKHIPGQRVVLYDWNGNVIRSFTESQAPDSCNFLTIRWDGRRDCLVHYLTDRDETGAFPCLIEDIYGNVLDRVYAVDADGLPDLEADPIVEKVFSYAVDLLGDSRDELVFFSGRYINVYSNTAPYNQRRHYNATHYIGE